MEDYPVTVFLSREGYFKKITPQPPADERRAEVQGGRRLRPELETTSKREVMFFTDQCQVYKTRLSEFEDSKASVLGDYLPTKLEMDAGESVVYHGAAGATTAGICCSSMRTARLPVWR